MGLSTSQRELAAGIESPAFTSPGTAVRYFSIAIIVFLWVATYFSSMFHPALLDDVDTIHAEAAREMVLRLLARSGGKTIFTNRELGW